MISGSREQLWFDRQIGSVQVSRIASLCREPDTASCPRHSSHRQALSKLWPSRAIVFLELKSHKIMWSVCLNFSFFLLPQIKITYTIEQNARQSLAIQFRDQKDEISSCAFSGKSKNLLFACPMHLYEGLNFVSASLRCLSFWDASSLITVPHVCHKRALFYRLVKRSSMRNI